MYIYDISIDHMCNIFTGWDWWSSFPTSPVVTIIFTVGGNVSFTEIEGIIFLGRNESFQVEAGRSFNRKHNYTKQYFPQA